MPVLGFWREAGVAAQHVDTVVRRGGDAVAA
jgi:hypothetical protein